MSAQNTQLATRDNTDTAAILEQVVVNGDLAGLQPAQRVVYYRRVCESLGLNELTQPFQYIMLDKKLTFYVTKTATDQLRKIHGISVVPVSEETDRDAMVYKVRVRATTPDGREDFATGIVSIGKEDGQWEGPSGNRYFKSAGTWSLMRGADRANAEMKAETKAKRRATLSICGLGWLDESELDTVPQARKVEVDFATGEIVDEQPPTQASKPSVSSSAASKPSNGQAAGGLLDAVTTIPDTLPTGAGAFVALVDAERAKLGRAPYGQPVILHGLLKRDMPDGFDWGMLKDPGAARVAYRIAIEHIRASEAA